MPNTYAFTKNLGEAITNEYLDKLPVIVVRPSVGEYLPIIYCTSSRIIRYVFIYIPAE